MRPVLLAHGFGSSFVHGWVETGWSDILADSGRTVIGVDLLGHGAAPKPHDPAAYDRGLHRSVLDVLPDGEPVDAIGFSLGAAVIMQLAIERSSAFGRLVLIGVGTHTLAAGAAAGTRDIEPSRVLEQLLAADRNDRAALEACWRRPQRPITAAALATLEVPTLVITSDADDLAGPPEPVAAAIPNASIVVLRGVDHFQTPREFACIDAALQFIEAG